MMAMRAYSWIFDQYLNRVLRGQGFVYKLHPAINEWEVTSNEFVDESLYTLCERITPPLKRFTVSEVIRVLPVLYKGLKDAAIPTTRRMSVYRSILVDKDGGRFNPRFVGFTSCSLSPTSAIHNATLNLDFERHRMILLHVTLPIGTHVIPLLCSRYHEREMIVCSQGALRDMTTDERKGAYALTHDTPFYTRNRRGKRVYASGKLQTYDGHATRGVEVITARLHITGELPSTIGALSSSPS